MKKFGFKRSESADDDSNRLALFGSRSKSKSPAPSANPYAQPPPPGDTYSQRPGPGAPNGHGAPPGPMKSYGGMNPPPNPYGNSDNKYGGSNGGYAAAKHGDQAGYGADRYGGAQSRYGAGGYGGLGSADPNAADDNREALFGGARDRFQQRQQNPMAQHGTPDGLDAPPSQPVDTYGPYQDRQLTAEEEEEEDIQAMKQDIRFMKQQDVSSTRNALRAAAQAEETGRNALLRLGAQGERIHNTEKNLDLASNQNRIADEKSRELKRLNKSMFAMTVNNPFTSAERRRQRDEAIIDRHQQERIQREETRRAAFQTEQRLDRTFKDMSKQGQSSMEHKPNLAERSKYQFEADSEDDEMENEIESNLNTLSGAAGRLNALARATGKEIETQNQHLDRIAGKSDFVDDQIHMNRARLDRIH